MIYTLINSKITLTSVERIWIPINSEHAFTLNGEQWYCFELEELLSFCIIYLQLNLKLTSLGRTIEFYRIKRKTNAQKSRKQCKAKLTTEL